MNGKILKETSCKQIFIQPAAGDAGTAIGSALYIYNGLLCKPRSFTMKHAYLGPEYIKNEIQLTLEKYKCKYTYYNEVEFEAAKLLAQGKIVGWFQGRMEFGPRALGNRSILADPRKAEMKDILNAKVKHREIFRPFAPATLDESFQEYFNTDDKSPYMILVSDVKEDKHSVIPAVTHVDGTGRLQTVNREYNPKYWNLINQFGKITGVPVILNTSFNVKGEPIVCTPEDAVKCFLGTNIDYLVIGNYIVTKTKEQKENLLVAVTQEQPQKKKPNRLTRWWSRNKYYPWYLFASLKGKINSDKIKDYYKDGGYDGKL